MKTRPRLPSVNSPNSEILSKKSLRLSDLIPGALWQAASIEPFGGCLLVLLIELFASTNHGRLAHPFRSDLSGPGYGSFAILMGEPADETVDSEIAIA